MQPAHAPALTRSLAMVRAAAGVTPRYAPPPLPDARAAGGPIPATAVAQAELREPLRLVRVQDQMYGMRVDERGNMLLLRAPREHYRNTFHFAANGKIQSHAYGKFDGAIAIVADPRQIPALPSGFRQEDVWFHADANGELNVGPATVIAPEGTWLPPTVRARFYDADSPDGLEEAVAQHLRDEGVTPRSFSFWGWSDFKGGPNEMSAWQEEALQGLYGERARFVQRTAHSGSRDDRMDSAMQAVAGALRTARQERFVEDSSGCEVPATDLVDLRIRQAQEAIAEFEAEAGPESLSRAGGYLGQLRADLERMRAENLTLRDRYVGALEEHADDAEPEAATAPRG